jgi:hypothetical protein
MLSFLDNLLEKFEETFPGYTYKISRVGNTSKVSSKALQHTVDAIYYKNSDRKAFLQSLSQLIPSQTQILL